MNNSIRMSVWISIFLCTALYSAHIQILTPNGREALDKNRNHRIEWRSQGVRHGFRLLLYRNNRKVYFIKTVRPNVRHFDWTPALYRRNVGGYGYQIRIEGVESDVSDMSDGFFSIVNSPVVPIPSVDFQLLDLSTTRDSSRRIAARFRNNGRESFNGSLYFSVWENQESPNGPATHNLLKQIDIGPGAERTVELSRIEQGDACGRIYCVKVDGNDAVTERNERNNVVIKRLYQRDFFYKLVQMYIGKSGQQQRVTAGTGQIVIRPAMIEQRYSNYGQKKLMVPIQIDLKNCGYDSGLNNDFFIYIRQYGYMQKSRQHGGFQPNRSEAPMVYTANSTRIIKHRVSKSQIPFESGKRYTIRFKIALHLVPEDKPAKLSFTFQEDDTGSGWGRSRNRFDLKFIGFN